MLILTNVSHFAWKRTNDAWKYYVSFQNVVAMLTSHKARHKAHCNDLFYGTNLIMDNETIQSIMTSKLWCIYRLSSGATTTGQNSDTIFQSFAKHKRERERKERERGNGFLKEYSLNIFLNVTII